MSQTASKKKTEDDYDNNTDDESNDMEDNEAYGNKTHKPHAQRICLPVSFHQDLYQLLQTMPCSPKESRNAIIRFRRVVCPEYRTMPARKQDVLAIIL